MTKITVAPFEFFFKVNHVILYIFDQPGFIRTVS